MERVLFQKKKKKVLKTIAITLTAVLAVAGILALLYLRFGIAGLFRNAFTSSMLGLDKQQDLAVPTLAADEKERISELLGYDPSDTDESVLPSRKEMELTLSPQGASYLLSAMLKDKDALENLQIAATADGVLELSAIADIGLLCESVGESKETIESTIGDLPDTVPVYTAVSLDSSNGNSSIQSIKIGNLKVPDGFYTALNGGIDDGLDLFFDNQLDIDLDYIGVEGDHVVIRGTFPSP